MSLIHSYPLPLPTFRQSAPPPFTSHSTAPPLPNIPGVLSPARGNRIHILVLLQLALSHRSNQRHLEAWDRAGVRGKAHDQYVLRWKRGVVWHSPEQLTTSHSWYGFVHDFFICNPTVTSSQRTGPLRRRASLKIEPILRSPNSKFNILHSLGDRVRSEIRPASREYYDVNSLYPSNS